MGGRGLEYGWQRFRRAMKLRRKQAAKTRFGSPEDCSCSDSLSPLDSSRTLEIEDQCRSAESAGHPHRID